MNTVLVLKLVTFVGIRWDKVPVMLSSASYFCCVRIINKTCSPDDIENLRIMDVVVRRQDLVTKSELDRHSRVEWTGHNHGSFSY
jgi:hypothetical protein